MTDNNIDYRSFDKQMQIMELESKKEYTKILLIFHVHVIFGIHNYFYTPHHVATCLFWMKTYDFKEFAYVC